MKLFRRGGRAVYHRDELIAAKPAERVVSVSMCATTTAQRSMFDLVADPCHKQGALLCWPPPELRRDTRWIAATRAILLCSAGYKWPAGPVRDGCFSGQVASTLRCSAGSFYWIRWRGLQFFAALNSRTKPEASAKPWDAPEAASYSI